MLTSHHAPAGREESQRVHMLRRWLLVVIGCDLGLLFVGAAHYPPFFSMPGALGYLAEPVIALAIYTGAVLALPPIASRIPHSSVALCVGTTVGLIAGAIEVMSTALESLVMLPQYVVSVTTGAAMLSLFLLFGVAGFVSSRRTHSFWLGMGTAIWSAIVAILIVVTFGFLLVTTSLPQLARDEIGDPDYLRSAWTDVRAFAIANTFDSGFTHLVESPVIAAMLGAAGSGVGRIGRLRARRRPVPQG